MREGEGVALESKSADGVDWRRTHWHKLCLTPPAGGKLFLTGMAQFILAAQSTSTSTAASCADFATSSNFRS